AAPKYRGGQPPASPPGGQDLVAIFGDRDRVLEVRGERPVFGHDRPVVGQDPGGPVADVDHWLHRHDQSGPHLGPPPRRTVVRDLRVLVEVPAHSTTCWTAWEMSDRRPPGRIWAIPASSASSVTRTSFSASEDGGSPTNTVTAESAWNPSQIAPKSSESRSPSRSTRFSEGMP